MRLLPDEICFNAGISVREKGPVGGCFVLAEGDAAVETPAPGPWKRSAAAQRLPGLVDKYLEVLVPIEGAQRRSCRAEVRFLFWSVARVGVDVSVDLLTLLRYLVAVLIIAAVRTCVAFVSSCLRVICIERPFCKLFSEAP